MSQHFGSYSPVHSFSVPDGVMDRICHSVIRNRKTRPLYLPMKGAASQPPRRMPPCGAASQLLLSQIEIPADHCGKRRTAARRKETEHRCGRFAVLDCYASEGGLKDIYDKDIFAETVWCLPAGADDVRQPVPDLCFCRRGGDFRAAS